MGKKYKYKLYLLLFSIILGLLFTEALIRIYISVLIEKRPKNSTKLMKYYKGTDKLRLLTPGFKGFYENKPVFINSKGLRDYEFSYKKPNNIYRIIVLGDSVTFGHGVEISQTYVKLLEKKLNFKFSNKFQIINTGIPGYNTKKEADYFEVELYKYNPDMVLVELLFNDAEIFDDPRRKNIKTQQFNLFHARRNIIFSRDFVIAGLFKKFLFHIGVLKDNVYSYNDYIRDTVKENSRSWIEFKESIKRLKDFSIKYNFKIIFVSFIGYRGHGRYQEVDKKMLKELKRYDIRIIDLRQDFKREKTDRVSPVDYHPGPKGHRIAAKGIYKKLLPLLKKEILN